MRCVFGRRARPPCGRSSSPESHGTDLLRDVQSRASLVLCLGHANRRSLDIQELRYCHGWQGTIYSTHRLCRYDPSPAGGTEGERRVSNLRFLQRLAIRPSSAWGRGRCAVPPGETTPAASIENWRGVVREIPFVAHIASRGS